MHEIGSTEAKARLPELLRTVEYEETVAIRGQYWEMVQAQRVLAESRTLSAIREG